MASFDQLTIGVDLKIFKLTGKLTDADRQAAWELYVELSTRTALVGKHDDAHALDFAGEVWAESLDSMHEFFGRARAIARSYPVGRIRDPRQQHLGVVTHRLLSQVLRPFLERWQARYRWWWETRADPALEPFERQRAYPERDGLIRDWTVVRRALRGFQAHIADTYQLQAITTHHEEGGDA